MFPEISLNVLDIAENSIAANAADIYLSITILTDSQELIFTIEDNGRGMSEEQVKAAQDPFYTTRTTRKVGLGIPFLKQEAEMSGGSFEIHSEEGKGTGIRAVFKTDSLDCMPLGDISETIHTLVVFNEPIHFVYTYRVDDRTFSLDTDAFHEILGKDISFREGEVSRYILDYLRENKQEIDGNGRS